MTFIALRRFARRRINTTKTYGESRINFGDFHIDAQALVGLQML